MRLLYVIDSLAPGGAETSLVAMTRGLVARGIELHVLPLGQALDLEPALIASGAIILKRTARPGRAGNLLTVLQAAKRLSPDLIHTTLFEADLAGRTGARIMGIPSSTSLVNASYETSHANEIPSWKFKSAQLLDRVTAQFSCRYHAVSNAVVDTVAPALGIPRRIIDVIPRGRDPEQFPFRPVAQREAARAELGVTGETRVILAVGRLEPQKGFQYLLAAIPQIASAVPNAVVLVAGREGRSSQALREQASHLQLPVRFLGHRNDISALLAAADVLAFPSEREGSPGTLIEAMAVGTPIVASSIAPCLEVLGAGKEPPLALIAPVGNSEALGRNVAAALLDPHAAMTRATSARARFERSYTIDAIANRMADFFLRAAQEPSP